MLDNCPACGADTVERCDEFLPLLICASCQFVWNLESPELSIEGEAYQHAILVFWEDTEDDELGTLQPPQLRYS